MQNNLLVLCGLLAVICFVLTFAILLERNFENFEKGAIKAIKNNLATPREKALLAMALIATIVSLLSLWGSFKFSHLLIILAVLVTVFILMWNLFSEIYTRWISRLSLRDVVVVYLLCITLCTAIVETSTLTDYSQFLTGTKNIIIIAILLGIVIGYDDIVVAKKNNRSSGDGYGPMLWVLVNGLFVLVQSFVLISTWGLHFQVGICSYIVLLALTTSLGAQIIFQDLYKKFSKKAIIN